MRSWMIWACPECGRYTADSDRIECDCDVGHWDEIIVVPDEDSTAVTTAQRNHFRAALEEITTESGAVARSIATEALASSQEHGDA